MTDFRSALADVDARFARQASERGIPGMAWGVLRDGRLVHTGGCGTVSAEDPTTPTADHVFRIASMTKSFTAATVLLLRDAGRLRLDDPVSLHVPALASWPPYAADAVPVTIRDLLTMSGGLATDDPWGDRQQGLAIDAFERLLAEGPSFALPPGVAFEYSNLGYGILGRVVTAAAGREYREVVRDRLLTPLGMTSTGYLEEEVPAERLMHGYVRQGDGLVREGRDGYGALAAMGGIFSTVRDLATWVGGFLDAFPARDDAEGAHPLRRVSRREMQQGHRVSAAGIGAHAPDEVPPLVVRAYGFGLEAAFDPELGTFVAHAGGYPGFGSHMAWHPATGLGVVGLGSLRYAPMRSVTDAALHGLVEAGVAARRAVVPLPATERAAATVDHLLEAWDEASADALFAMNMDLDEPRERRRRAVEAAVATVGGPLRADAGRAGTSDTPAERTWWRRGERGWLRVQARLTPEATPRLQSLAVEAVLDPSPELTSAANTVLAAAAAGASLPEDLALDASLDLERLARTARAASARFGAMRLGLPIASDGTSTATWSLRTERGGRAQLRLVRDAATGTIREAALLVPEREMPYEGW
ncbi:MAG TPA: serine hydrolase domain-containing protein [Candidatus Limnocylindrales bacterium]